MLNTLTVPTLKLQKARANLTEHLVSGHTYDPDKLRIAQYCTINSTLSYF